jgi:hypothetical protein
MEDRSGYVYLLKADTPFDGCYKIGRTGNPQRRLRDFGVKLPFETRPVLIVHTDDMYDLEVMLHSSFNYRRRGGEWFQLTGLEIELVRAAMLFAEVEETLDRLLDRRPVYRGDVKPEEFAARVKVWAKVIGGLANKYERRLLHARDLNVAARREIRLEKEMRG